MELQLIKANEYGLTESKAQQIENVFLPMVAMLKDFEEVYNKVIAMPIENPESATAAKRLRLDISKIRIEADKVHKAAKEESLRTGKAIDGIRNILKYAVTEKEEALKKIETYAERMEADRIEKLASKRIVSLLQYGIEEEETGHLNLGEMAQQVFDNFLAGIKANYESRIKAEREAEEAEAARLKAEAEERARMKKENELLKAEAEKIEKERIAERKKQEELLKAEHEKQAKLQAEIKAKVEAERKAAEAEAEKVRKASLAPDREKLISFAASLKLLVMPNVQSDEAKAVLNSTKLLLQKVDDYINEKAKDL